MAKQQKNQIFVLKINTNYLKKHNWHLDLSLNEIRKNGQMVVSLGSSQVLRWLIQIQGRQNDDYNASQIKKEIKRIKKQPNSVGNKRRVCELYNNLYKIQFQPDLMMLVMDSVDDYKRALEGYTISVDGKKVKYKRLLGTTGGIKKNTILFVNEKVYDELMVRLNNGRNMSQKFVAAKLNAYLALACSGSISVTWPRIIVVNDVITNFKHDVLLVEDNGCISSEPTVTPVKDKEIENNASDGFGLVDPEHSKLWAQELHEGDEPLSGYNTRGAFLKGMLFTVPYKQFAEEVAHNYKIIDAWGDERDVRDSDAIVTTSMLKLWDAYPNYESYYENCMKNNYDFGIAKSAPRKLRNKHTTNYQQIQDYNLTDAQIEDLIAPTIDNIKDCLGLDWRKLILYLCGKGLDETTVKYADPMCKAIMANHDLIKDPYVRSKVSRMINKRINEAKIGVLDVEGDYAIMGGDPYSLMQSIFGLKVTGLLKYGEVYHKYWYNKGVNEVVGFRAPMTTHNNVVKWKVVSNNEMEKWYRYIKTCCLLNSWDTSPIRLNGADFDSDTVETTNNNILLNCFRDEPTLMCVQQSTQKCIPTEDDFVVSDINGFGDSIGSVTNKATAMISLRTQFDEDSEQYKLLSYRINTMMHFQQNAIDRIKGVVSRPIPKTWLYRRENKIDDDASDEDIHSKEICKDIAVDLKPWFFMHRYSAEKAKFTNYDKSVRSNCKIRFGKSLDELLIAEVLTEDENKFVENYYKYMPISKAPSTMNRICWKIEEEFKTTNVLGKTDFDCSILKNNSEYSLEDYTVISELYNEYNKNMQLLLKRKQQNESSDENIGMAVDQIKNTFVDECTKVCPDQKVLSNIIVDVCYSTSKNKTFAWDIVGEQIFQNVLINSNSKITFPTKDECGDIEFMGERFSLCEIEMVGDCDDFE